MIANFSFLCSLWKNSEHFCHTTTLKKIYFFISSGIPVHAILFAYMGDFWGTTVSFSRGDGGRSKKFERFAKTFHLSTRSIVFQSLRASSHFPTHKQHIYLSIWRIISSFRSRENFFHFRIPYSSCVCNIFSFFSFNKIQFVRLYNRYKKYKIATNRNWVPLKLNLIGQITLYLIPAMIVFIFFPACLFTYFEGWEYTISVYYAFVTLTTIGKLEAREAVLMCCSLMCTLSSFFYLLSVKKQALVITFPPSSPIRSEHLAYISSFIRSSSSYGS